MIQPDWTRQFITKFYSRLYIFSGISYHVTCSQKHLKVVYKIKKTAQLVLFIWDNKQFQILLIVTFWETFYIVTSSLSSEKWGLVRREDYQSSWHTLCVQAGQIADLFQDPSRTFLNLSCSHCGHWLHFCPGRTTFQANHFLQVWILFPSEPFLDFRNHQKVFLRQPIYLHVQEYHSPELCIVLL